MACGQHGVNGNAIVSTKKLYRHRQCDNPPPVNRGTDCEGSAYDYQIDVGICDPSCPGTLTGFKA